MLIHVLPAIASIGPTPTHNVGLLLRTELASA